MLLRDLFLPEFDAEVASTRRLLEVWPESKLGFQPHPKNQTLQQLVSHLVDIPGWVGFTLEQDELDFATGDFKTPQMESVGEALAAFDSNVAAARKAIAACSDETFAGNWTLRAGPQVYFTQPKHGVLRGFVLNHLIHHRAQLGVYLRLLDVPLPSVYGPTADAPM